MSSLTGIFFGVLLLLTAADSYLLPSQDQPLEIGLNHWFAVYGQTTHRDGFTFRRF